MSVDILLNSREPRKFNGLGSGREKNGIQKISLWFNLVLGFFFLPTSSFFEAAMTGLYPSSLAVNLGLLLSI